MSQGTETAGTEAVEALLELLDFRANASVEEKVNAVADVLRALLQDRMDSLGGMLSALG